MLTTEPLKILRVKARPGTPSSTIRCAAHRPWARGNCAYFNEQFFTGICLLTMTLCRKPDLPLSITTQNTCVTVHERIKNTRFTEIPKGTSQTNAFAEHMYMRVWIL